MTSSARRSSASSREGRSHETGSREVQAQVHGAGAQYGESVTLDRGGVDARVRAVFEPANAAVIATYFDDNAAVGLVRPVRPGVL